MSAGIVDFWRRQLAAGPPGVAEVLRLLREPGLVRALALEAAGCRLVQDALEVADHEAVSAMAAELQGSVLEAALSPYGNHVLQKLVAAARADQVAFVAEELLESAGWLAHHAYGCRVLSRLVEHASQQPAVRRLVDAALASAERSIVHDFGHHVLECVLEHGSPEQRGRILEALRWDVLRAARSNSGAFVLEKALRCGSMGEQEELAAAILSCSAAEVAKLSHFHLGRMVLRALLRLPPPLAGEVEAFLAHPDARRQFATCRRGRVFLGCTASGSESASTQCESESSPSVEES